ncbi:MULTISPECIES: LLM class flavin-dependent oxidoreductase [unclassified Beijerinckia]|uniref:LLM class flavin-dependent oxidoreductase n=1 Tax=unclassified Beijerinckia TaxID=2638183 RepID=UPI0008958151|nr:MULTISPECIES: LLM class flavin-dependent oxidoreductase [unclassified Beijerinckia]MDH7796888.1 alkanesulfonate monooxygenase SsuD/methylene tetrahydromethanopterin reductase-like flavin-dependent oxidoreductase (luciferase family) [Beijerinckia sp. GAS462]SEC63892.1 Flavin-dependent oxidoreductase, luciferase family (includes alkanesulfonate monooxygenase SsuD and methylene tetrahydromethanopterin reductase) [Beijerinckia sp. 28-YEA-48]
MQFFLFHLMPYADLDLSASDKYQSAWVTLPNSYYDPRKGHLLYNRYLDELEMAEPLGFDGICVNEHHSNAYGLMPQPGVLAGALARRTKNVKIALLGRALPLVNNPVTIAEEFSIIDNITGGRFIAGFVRGIGAEYFSWNVNPALSHERFHEAHDLIIQAWTKTGPFAFEGKHYNFNYVNLWPRPYQTPHPPVWIPSQGSTETIEWAAHPSRRYTYLQTFSPVTALAKYMQQYRDSAERQGWQATSDHLGWSVPCYVAETDEIAMREARPHAEAFYQKFLRMPPEMLLPPGYLSLQSMQGVMRAKAQMQSGNKSLEAVMESGMFLCGSAATVRDKILHFQKEIGFGKLLTMLQFATLPHDLAVKNMTIYANEVMEPIRKAQPALATAK